MSGGRWATPGPRSGRRRSRVDRRRELAPHQLVTELVVEPDEHRLDERRVGLERHDGVRRHEVEPGKHQVLVHRRQRLRQRLREVRRDLQPSNAAGTARPLGARRAAEVDEDREPGGVRLHRRGPSERLGEHGGQVERTDDDGGDGGRGSNRCR